MTYARPARLLATSLLLLACGDSSGSGSGLSVGGDGGSNVSSASASASTGATDTPTGGGASASEASATTHGGMSGDATTHTTGDTGEATVAASTTVGASGDTTAGTVTATTSQDDGTTAPPIDEPVPCQVETTQITPIPPDVLFVLDKSGSMSMEQWDHDDNPQTPNVTRWYSLHGVVKSIVTTFNKTVNFGVKLYPKIDAGSYVDKGACIVDPGVEVEIAPMNAIDVLNGIPKSDFQVLGGTPIEAGLKEAYKYLQALDPGKQRFALMVADGEISKTCPGEVYKEALGAVTTAHSMGINTYVVGIDVDPSISEQLGSLAQAGGKPNPNNVFGFYETTSQVELQAAMQQIVDDTLSCVIDVVPEPSEPELFEVWIGDDQIPAAADCAKDDGWVWTKPHVQIELCGASCLELKKVHEVEARYFCTAM